MQASDIIKLLEESSRGAHAKQRIIADASTTEIVRAELAPIQWRKNEETGRLNRGVENDGNGTQTIH